MDLITLDFETYYDRDYSCRKITTEAYVRDPRFEVIGVGVKLNNEETEWASGTHEQIKQYLNTFPWEKLCYFAITLCLMVPFLLGCLIFVLGCIPILCVSPVLYTGLEARASLAALSERYRFGAKGTEVSTHSVNGVQILNPKT